MGSHTCRFVRVARHVLVFLTSCSSFLAAQVPADLGPVQFALARRVLPSPGYASSVELVEISGDGDVDLVIRTGNALTGYTGDGDGRFLDELGELDVDLYLDGDHAWFDADGDGDLDLVVARVGSCYIQCTDAQTRLYTNDGMGAFSDATAQLPIDPTEPSYAVAAGDVDADGDLDLVLGGVEHQWYDAFGGTVTKTSETRVLLNDGAGTFTELFGHGLPSWDFVEVGLADFDGDGADEFFGVNAIGDRVRVFANDGSGSFTSTPWPMGGPVFISGFGDATPADVDLDGDTDLLVSYVGSGMQIAPILFANDGTGALVEMAQGFGGAVGGNHAAGDLDGDGDLDMVVLGAFEATALLNDGSGLFGAPRAVTNYGRTTLGEIADVDGDGDGDLLTNGELYLGDGSGRLVNVTDAIPPVPTTEMVGELFDVDGDGDQDLALGYRSYGLNDLMTNDGAGRFERVSAGSFTMQQSTSHLVGADIDGDGFEDLVEARRDFARPSVVHLSDGTTLASAVTLAGSERAESVDVGDVDGDGDLDVYLGTIGVPDRVYLGDGSGGFTLDPSPMPASSISPEDILLADLDGDGDLDVTNGRELAFNSSGQFTASSNPFGGIVDLVHVVRAGDLDLDGNLDVVLGTTATTFAAAADRLFLGDGQGGFVDATAGLADGVQSTRDLTLTDLNRDGLVDLIRMHRTGTTVSINDGAANFTTEPQTELPILTTGFAPSADLDGDGDVDFISVSIFGANTAFNLERQISTVGPPRIGKELRFLVTGRPLDTLIFICWSPTRTALDLGPVGTLYLDPSTLRVESLVGSSGGITTRSLTLPNSASLVGLELYAQANTMTFLTGGNLWRLTNLETLPITDL